MNVGTYGNFLFSLVKKLKPVSVLTLFIGVALLETLCTPYLYTVFSQQYIKSPEKAFICILVFFVITLFVDLIKLVSRKYRDAFTTKIAFHFMSWMYEHIYKSDWIKIRNIDEKIRNDCQRASNDTQGFIFRVIDGSFGVVSILGNIMMIAYIFPFAIFVYIVSFTIFYYYYYVEMSSTFATKRIVLQGKSQILRKKQCNLQDGLFHKLLHHQEKEAIGRYVNVNIEMNNIWSSFNQDRDSAASILCIVSISLTIINMLLFINFRLVESLWVPGVMVFCPTLNSSIIIESVVLIYVYNLNGVVHRINDLVKVYDMYQIAELSFRELVVELEKFTARKSIKQVPRIKKISFCGLHYYITDGKRKFTLWSDKLDRNIQNEGNDSNDTVVITLEQGGVYLINGKSGAGKSQLIDVLAGIVSHENYEVDLVVNDNLDEKLCGFDSLTRRRAIRLQSDNIRFKDSPFGIITGIIIENSDDVGDDNRAPDIHAVNMNTQYIKEEKLVLEIIKIVKADDFVNRDNLYHKYSSKDAISGGERARLETARTLYQVLGQDLDIIILDEPDGALHENARYAVISNIIEYAIANNKILLLSLHSNDLKKLFKFTKIINVDHGHVSQSNTINHFVDK